MTWLRLQATLRFRSEKNRPAVYPRPPHLYLLDQGCGLLACLWRDVSLDEEAPAQQARAGMPRNAISKGHVNDHACMHAGLGCCCAPHWLRVQRAIAAHPYLPARTPDRHSGQLECVTVASWSGSQWPAGVRQAWQARRSLLACIESGNTRMDQSHAEATHRARQKHRACVATGAASTACGPPVCDHNAASKQASSGHCMHITRLHALRCTHCFGSLHAMPDQAKARSK